jgi:transcriptional regulator with XRE-family HTH domain
MTKHPVDAHVGQKIRHRRWLKDITQQQLAAACGIKFQQIQKYENGQNRVSCSRLWEIAAALDVPVQYFFEGLEGGATEMPEELSKETATLAGRIDRLPHDVGAAITGLVAALDGNAQQEEQAA